MHASFLLLFQLSRWTCMQLYGNVWATVDMELALNLKFMYT